MIQFFRKIRQQLLSENRFTKYLLYAVGEIILVVIGILIALQINNWNIENKERSSEKYYLKQIQQDLIDDKQSLVDFRSMLNNKVPRIELLLIALHGETDISSFKAVFQDYTDNVWLINWFTSNSTTYEEMKSSGNLGLIKNNEIRNDIMKFYTNLDSFETSLKFNADWVLPVDLDITHNKGVAKLLTAQSSVFSPYITNDDYNKLLKLKEELINNAATHHWVIKDLTPYIDAQLKEADLLISKLAQYSEER